MTKRYVLHPGPVESISDGQYHFIDASQLASLYGVPLDECYIVDYRKPETHIGIDFTDKSRLISLYPQRYKEEYEDQATMLEEMRKKK